MGDPTPMGRVLSIQNLSISHMINSVKASHRRPAYAALLQSLWYVSCIHIPNARLENGQRYAICVDSKPVTHRSFIIEDNCESEAPSSRRLILARDSR